MSDTGPDQPRAGRSADGATRLTGRRLYAQFDGQAILAEQGRMLFALLRAFSCGGWQIRLRDRFAAPLGKYGELVRALPGLTLTEGPPADQAGWVALCDDDSQTRLGRQWQRRIRIAFDTFAPYWFSTPVLMPFPMHPSQADVGDQRLAELRGQSRRMKVFFSGDSKGYGRTWIRHPRPKLTRLEVLKALIESGDDHIVLLPSGAALRGPGASAFDGRCVIGDPAGCWIDSADWLSTVALADFFLSPPGIVMPMCHNIVEAIAVGTVPITNYPEWFSPPLCHLENCIVFDDADDLRAKVRLAMAMPAAERERLKANAIAYYEQCLRPEGFVRRIEARPERQLTVLLHAERNTSLNTKKLGRSSVLLAADRLNGPPRSWARIWCG